jgi:peroxiredoxin
MREEPDGAKRALSLALPDLAEATWKCFSLVAGLLPWHEREYGMTANIENENLDDAFKRVRDLDVSLREQLNTFAETVRRSRPEFAVAVDRLVNRLHQYGAGESAPQIGQPMPPFLLPDEAARMVSLTELLNRGPVAVTFQRGHWCPYCRININALVQAYKELTACAGQIVAIMPDRQEFAAELKLQSNVPFPILTDTDNGYALSLNLAIWVGTEMQKMMEDRLDLPTFQGNSSWILPIPATFVVGRDGLIKARFIDPDCRKRMTIADMIAAMRSCAD